MNRSGKLPLVLGVLIFSGCGGSGNGEVKQVGAAPVAVVPPQPPAPARSSETIPSFCSSPAKVSGSAEREATESGSPVDFQQMQVGSYFNPVESFRCVVRTMEEWEQLRAAVGSEGVASITPELFTDGMLLVASMGEQYSGGYYISIESVRSRSGELIVSVRSDVHEQNEPVTMGITHPVALVRVAKSQEPVRFRER